MTIDLALGIEMVRRDAIEMKEDGRRILEEGAFTEHRIPHVQLGGPAHANGFARHDEAVRDLGVGHKGASDEAHGIEETLVPLDAGHALLPRRIVKLHIVCENGQVRSVCPQAGVILTERVDGATLVELEDRWCR